MKLYYFYAILTAPGVIVHELAYAFFCFLSGVKIYKINLFRFQPVAGYVVHAEPKGFMSSWLISFGPLVINSYLAMFLFAQVRPLYDWWDLLFLYLGIAVALQAIPSTGDAESLLLMANRNFWKNPLVILLYPLVLILYLLNLLKRFYFDWAYAIFLFYIGQAYFIHYVKLL
ncbi:hypothetical protein COX68_01970 [Candidatus Falkowbacteria bacterium CG_4_10_14_0_2_um_filter_41_15]|uniref:DUF3267 domain-containing protein n=1 Tax=Candidatus Falkowbacteria bacterium CG_4_10_14_0_2_um_filter_41_15 TaxID=1974554 RepID=A0A2M7VZ53_9BACT|nr:MAG: hypothetical protein COX68_01970 [Candidatus Falkowbacteria bacterium CG_4_10_14_0_2_um_filter_41_15]